MLRTTGSLAFSFVKGFCEVLSPMKNIKFGVFVLGLALAVAGAVSVAAQDRDGRPSTRTRPYADVFSLRTDGAQLGVRVSDVDAKEPAGARIEEVVPDSPAGKAGLQEGDLVVEYDGERVRSARQFTRLVQETPEGRAVKMSVLRNGQRVTLEAVPEHQSMTWGFDGEPGSGIRDPRFFLRRLPEFNFNFEEFPRRFDFRIPDPGSRRPAPRGRLGVTVQSLTPELEEYFGARNGGVLVSSVAPKSAAATAGLKAGDVITSINGRPINDSGDLMRELSDLSGDVTIVVLRDKKELTLKATVSRGSGVL